MIRVLIADDEWHYARALQIELGEEPDLEILETVRSAEDAVERAAALLPDVVLLDLRLPTMGGIEACQRLVELDPQPTVVMVTGSDVMEDFRAALAAGARGYVVKRGDEDPKRVADLMRHALAGELVVDKGIRDEVVRLTTEPARDPAEVAGLTAREREILPLLAEGLQNKQIAVALGIGDQTVRNHVSKVLHKLGVTNRTGAVGEARKKGILP